MRTRKLLIITLYFPPCAAIASQRMIGLVRYLSKYNWHTIVVAPPSVHEEPYDPNLVHLIPTETNTLYSVPFTKGFLGKIHRKYAPNKWWMFQARRAIKKAIAQHQPDAVLTTFPPSIIHELGLWVKRRFNLPWIADFRDPWSGLAPAGSEEELMQLADRVISTTPTYASQLQLRYPWADHKIKAIINGYDPDNFMVNLSPPHRERLIIMYTGELYFNRNPIGLLDALVELHNEETSNNEKVGFHFIGRSEQYDLQKEVSSRGLNEVVTLDGRVPYKECLELSAQADILVMIQTEGHTAAIPAKLFEYIGAKRPILVLADPPGDIEWVLQQSGTLHRIAPVRDVALIKKAIKELLAELANNSPVISEGRDILLFTREYMVQQFAAELDSLVN